MNCKSLSVVLAAVVASLTAASVFAQAPGPTVIVAFSSGTVPVPLGPWTGIAAALFIVLLAAMIFRRRAAGNSIRPVLWFALVAAIAGAAITGVPADLVRSANANAGGPTPLTTSPTSIAIGNGAAFVTAVNATSTNITIVSVSIANGTGSQQLQFPATTCSPPSVLAPGATCNISVIVSGGG